MIHKTRSKGDRGWHPHVPHAKSLFFPALFLACPPDQADLPYTQDGVVPDILFNSHGIPSRMTMGQIWEQVISKVAALMGDEGTRGVPFTHIERLRDACQQLHERGFQRMGREVMPPPSPSPKRGQLWRGGLAFSGITGERLDGDVFLGCVYYQRLRPGDFFFARKKIRGSVPHGPRQVPRPRPRPREPTGAPADGGTRAPRRAACGGDGTIPVRPCVPHHRWTHRGAVTVSSPTAPRRSCRNACCGRATRFG